MTRLLVTGFGPFPRMPRNPSAALACTVAASPRLRLHGIEARAVILTTAYATLRGELDPLLGEAPDMVLLLGVAGRARRVRVETRATARRSTLFPDANGAMPEAERVASRPPRRCRVNADAARRTLRSRGLPVRLSRDPGRYLCNAAYHRALARTRPTLFVHVPKEPRGRSRRTEGLVGPRWNAALAAGLVDVALGLLTATRRVVAGPAIR